MQKREKCDIQNTNIYNVDLFMTNIFTAAHYCTKNQI